MLTVSCAITKFLEKKGVKTAYAVVGGAIEEFTNSMAESPIELIFPPSESTAVFAAAQQYATTKTPCAVFCTTGPGIMCLVNALGSTLDENRPVFVVVPQEPLSSHDRGAFQSSRYGGINTLNILREVTCYADEIISEKHVEQKLNLAWNKMTSHQQPVCISVPTDVFRTVCGAPHLFPEPVALTESVLSGMTSDDCFIIGERCDAALPGLLSLASHLGISVVDTPKSRGILPDTLPCYAGMIGMAGHKSAKQAMDAAKTAYFFFGEVQETNIGKNDPWLNKTVLISNREKDLFRGRFKNIRSGEATLISHVEKRLAALGAPRTAAFPLEHVHAALNYRNAERVTTPMLMAFFSEHLPEDTVSFFDTGNSLLFGLHHWKVKKSTCHSQKQIQVCVNQGTMAWAIPSLYGALHAVPDAHYFCVTGDGSMNMGSDDLGLIATCRGHAIIVVLNDCVMGMVMHGQRMSGAVPAGFNNPRVDYTQVGEVHGIETYLVKSFGDLKKVPLDRDHPILVDARVDPETIPPIADRIDTLTKDKMS